MSEQRKPIVARQSEGTTGVPVSEAFKFWVAEQNADPDYILELEAELAALRDIKDAVRPVLIRHYSDIKPGKRMDELSDALDAYDALMKGRQR